MKSKLFLTFCLCLMFSALLRAENNGVDTLPNPAKLKLGLSTDSRGLTAVGGAAPTFKPRNQYYPYSFLDTTANIQWEWSGATLRWVANGDLKQALPPLPITSTYPGYDRRVARWIDTDDNNEYVYNYSLTAWVPDDGIHIAASAPTDIASGGSNGAAVYSKSFWYDSINSILKQWNGSSWVSSGSLDPTMGGDLTGTASNAQIAPNAIAWVNLEQAVKDSISGAGIDATYTRNDSMFIATSDGNEFYIGEASTIMINNSNGVIPYRTSNTTFADSPIFTDGVGNISTLGTATFGIGKFTTGIYDNAGTPKLSISPHNRTLYKANGTTPILNWGLDESLIWGDSAGVNQSHDTGGYSTGYPYPGNTIKGNVFIGNLAGKATTDDDEGDVFIGNGAGQFSVGAPQNPPNNTYVGLMSGQMNTNGYYNVYMGGLAGRANTNGYANVFVGWGSGHYQNTANNNYQTYVGVESGIWGGGNNNTCLGARSGMSTIFNEGGLGANNTMVGVYTGGSYNQSGVYAKINNTTLMGYFAGAVNRQDGLVAYGYAAGSNNSTGDLNTFIGYNSGLDNKTGSNNTLLGYSAGAKIKGSGLTAIGTYAGRSDTTGNSVYIGYLAGFSNVTGTNNVHIGSAAGQNSTSSENVFIGNLAGRNSTGASNTFVGYQAGINNTSGSEGTYFGRGAGYANTTGVGNVLFGEYAGQSITTNSNLVALGRYAASANTGGNSVHLGYLSGFSNVTGTGNVFLGNYSGRYETGSNSFYVDSQERGNIAGGKAGALMYGTFDANPANQHLQINADIRFGGSTSAFPSLKYSGDKIQARLADGSGYTDIEVATEAYGAPWNGSNETPTKDALFDKIETLGSATGGTYTPTLSPGSGMTVVSSGVHSYSRIANHVTVFGYFEVSLNAGTVAQTINITFPIAAAYAASVVPAPGAASNDYDGNPAVTSRANLYIDGVNDEIQISIARIGVGGDTQKIGYTVTYQIP